MKRLIPFLLLLLPFSAHAELVAVTSIPPTTANFGGQGTPGISAGAASGSGATASITGTNENGIIMLSTGSSTSQGVLVTVTFDNSIPINTAPLVCILQVQGINAGSQMAVVFPSVPTTSGWTINNGAAPLPANISSFQWGYRCR